MINDSVQVKFMRRNSNGLYEFTEEREALHPKTDARQKMTLPTMTPAGRAYLYKFEEGELDMLEDKFSLK